MKCPLIVVVLAGSLLLAGCATETVFRPAGTVSAAAQDRPFTVSGRISVNMDGKGSVGQFDWAHQPQADLLSVNSPLGSTVAQLRRDATGVTLLADGKSWQAANVEDLTTGLLNGKRPGEISDHVLDRDRLAGSAHPLGRHHNRQSLHQVAQYLEGCRT